VVVAIVVASLGLPGCGDDDGSNASASPGPFELSTSPEFVNMVIPGRRPLGLVAASGEGIDAIDLDATTSIDGVFARRFEG
jgi:hypothetical protein